MMGVYSTNSFGYGGGWMMMGGMFLLGIVLIGLLVIGFIVMQKYWKPQTNQNNAIEILKTRLASGEITEEEYERLKQKVK